MKNAILDCLLVHNSKCKFSRSCNLFSNSSYTCMHAGGDYCGKYRTLRHSVKTKRNQIRNERLTEVPQ
jgi:hypothetical protein